MKSYKKIGTIFSLAALALLPTVANAQRMTFQKDSVFLFSYATTSDEGRSGLKLAWSRDNKNWFAIGDGMSFIKCDYANWGKEKRMYNPVLYRDAQKGWHAVWQLNGNGKEFAHAASLNLTDWKAQEYFTDAHLNEHVSESWQKAVEAKATVNGEQQQGTVIRVAWEDVNYLQLYAGEKIWRNQLHNELMEQDPVRFAGLKPVRQTLTLRASESKPISDKLIGVFFEDINYGADGGLYAELIQNRDFEYTSSDRKEWGATTAWSVKGEARMEVGTSEPIHINNSHYLILESKSEGAALVNEGYDGICLKKGEKYDVSFFSRTGQTGQINKVKVALLDKDGFELCSSVLKVGATQWRKQKTVLVPKRDADAATFVLTPLGTGSIELDMVSLFPQQTFRGHTNGLRADLAQTIADLHPRFVRFPGGCVAHGNGIDNIYRWKNTIGPLEARKPMRNLWGYHQSMGLGYYEYFRFCEDMGAEPLPVLAAGVPCQNTSCKEGELLSGGQQGGIPMEEMDEYVQDVLDLIDYANGDPKKSKWAKMRAEAGHPKPFNLKYIGIGNEDLITDVFKERFNLINRAVKAKYPDIQVVGTVGPFYEGSDYEEGWKLAEQENIDLVDEHYYNTPGWFIYNQDFYDKYPRERHTKVYLGEYASHVPGRANNIETALSEALYLTAVERNGDVVAMTSYAPLLAKEKHTQWNPDLIYFNNQEVKPTVGYYVQQLYGQNAGDEYLPADRKVETSRSDVNVRIGSSIVRDSKSGDVIVKLVNLLPVSVYTALDLSDIGIGTTEAHLTVLKGQPSDRNATPVKSQVTVSEKFDYELPAYSFHVIRIPAVQQEKK